MFVAVLLSNPINTKDCEINMPITPEAAISPKGFSGILNALIFLVKSAAAINTSGI